VTPTGKSRSICRKVAPSARSARSIYRKKLNPAAVESLTKAAPLLKSNAAVYARNQYRLGFAYLNLRNTAGAKQAFTDAASVDSPYKGPAQDKLKGIAAAKAPAKKGS